LSASSQVIYLDKYFGTIIAFRLIGHFPDSRQAEPILCSDPPKIAAELIPFIGMMLVLLLMYETRASDLRLVTRILANRK